MEVLPYGRAALLIELDDVDRAARLRARLEAEPVSGVLETMPGLHTVLVRFDPNLVTGARLAALLRHAADDDCAAQPQEAHADEVTVRVDYSGPDLGEIAQLTELSTAQLIDRHAACTYRVVLIGMAPGFYFLSGGDPILRVPRRSTPRTDVPKAAVGLAGELTGIYPRAGPGGWQLIGTAMDDLWHPSKLPAALLPLGTTVRFEPA